MASSGNRFETEIREEIKVKATNILAAAGILGASVASADLIEISLTGESNDFGNAWAVEMGAWISGAGGEGDIYGGIGYNEYYGGYFDQDGNGGLDYDNIEVMNDGETGVLVLDLNTSGDVTFDIWGYDSYGDGWHNYNMDASLTVTNLTTGEVYVDGWYNDGSGNNLAGSFTIPAPGALALLGLAGVAGRRRRRA